MPPIFEWQTFLTVQAGAAATPTGLVFVVASAVLIPRQRVNVLAWEIILIALVSWIVQTVTQVGYASLRAGHSWSWLISRVVFSQLATIPFLVAGIGLLLGMPGAFGWLVPGFAFSFAAGILSAWVLLIEILR